MKISMGRRERQHEPRNFPPGRLRPPAAICGKPDHDGSFRTNCKESDLYAFSKPVMINTTGLGLNVYHKTT